MNSPLLGQRASRYNSVDNSPDPTPARSRAAVRYRRRWTDGISSCPDSGTLARSGFHSGRVLSGNRYSAIWDALARGFATPELHHSLGPDLRGAGRGRGASDTALESKRSHPGIPTPSFSRPRASDPRPRSAGLPSTAFSERLRLPATQFHIFAAGCISLSDPPDRASSSMTLACHLGQYKTTSGRVTF